MLTWNRMDSLHGIFSHSLTLPSTLVDSFFALYIQPLSTPLVYTLWRKTSSFELEYMFQLFQFSRAPFSILFHFIPTAFAMDITMDLRHYTLHSQ